MSLIDDLIARPASVKVGVCRKCGRPRKARVQIAINEYDSEQPSKLLNGKGRYAVQVDLCEWCLHDVARPLLDRFEQITETEEADNG